MTTSIRMRAATNGLAIAALVYASGAGMDAGAKTLLPEGSAAAPAAAPSTPVADASGPPPPVCLSSPAAGVTPPVAHPPSNVRPYRPFPATWQKTLDALTKNGDIPGAVIIVKSPDWGVRVGTTGVANLATGAPIRPDMQFRVGSVSKAFMAQAILRLEQEGKLQLTAPVLTYLGDNKVAAGIPNIDKTTVEDLLQMKSGIANYLDAPAISYSPQATPQKAFKPNELISVLSAAPPRPPELTPYFAPGDTYPNPYYLTVLNPQYPKPPPPPAPAPYPMWNYSNSNYILLGLIAEKVTGLKVEDLLKRYVFDVAGLGDTYFATDDLHDLAMHGYTKWGEIPYDHQVYAKWCDVTATNPTYAWTAGAIVSTPWDLLQFEDTMFTTDKLLNAGTKNKWFTFVSSDIHVGWEEMQYGVGGLMQAQRAYGTARGHGGAFPGYKTLIYYFGDQQTSFVLASNTWDQEWEVVLLDSIMPEVSSAVTTPTPSNTAAPVSVGPGGAISLGWQAGRVYGQSYNLYWGTDADAVDRASEASHSGVQLKSVPGVQAQAAVAAGKTYYWRVDTVAPGKALPLVIGPLWQFTTR